MNLRIHKENLILLNWLKTVKILRPHSMKVIKMGVDAEEEQIILYSDQEQPDEDTEVEFADRADI